MRHLAAQTRGALAAGRKWTGPADGTSQYTVASTTTVGKDAYGALTVFDEAVSLWPHRRCALALTPPRRMEWQRRAPGITAWTGGTTRP